MAADNKSYVYYSMHRCVSELAPMYKTLSVTDEEAYSRRNENILNSSKFVQGVK